MRKVFLILTITVISHSVFAQWRKITDFQGWDDGSTVGEYITCVYFYDSLAPPKIGFVGTASELHKTIDGGKSWISVWDSGVTGYNYYVTDICFKDSVIGWFTVVGGTDACYRTSDAGETWSELNVPLSTVGADAVHYCSATNRLFLSVLDTGMMVSTDLGDTWNQATTWYTGGFSFSSDSNGIVAAYLPSDSNQGLYRTSDGGVTWNEVVAPLYAEQPLAIPGTPICFESDLGDIIIRRSDDYGQTWRVVKDFGPVQDSQFNEIAPYGTGIIRGDLSRLFIQTDSGMYVSIDSGVTWKFDGGPTYITNFSNDRFYSANGVTFAGKTYADGGDEDGGLWEEIWPQSGVAEPEPSASTLRVFPNPASGNLQIMGGEAGSVHLFDLLGRERMSGSTEGTNTTLDVSSLPPGMYFVSDGHSEIKLLKE
jgi:Secretion system C-terminal sorting domain